MRRRPAGATAYIAVALAPTAAQAHLVTTRFGELYSGVLHPLSALEHLVPWLALGLLGGFQGRETARWVLLVFPATVLIGALIGAVLPGYAFVTYVNILSITLLGGLVALAGRTGPSLFLGLTALLGLSHGYANGTAELSGSQQLLYLLGVTIAAYLLVTLATGASHFMVRQTRWTRIAVRALGSWIAAIGILFGGFFLVRVAA